MLVQVCAPVFIQLRLLLQCMQYMLARLGSCRCDLDEQMQEALADWRGTQSLGFVPGTPRDSCVVCRTSRMVEEMYEIGVETNTKMKAQTEQVRVHRAVRVTHESISPS
jgi:hypothetical protein